ncbi:MAG: hypothetical protein IJW32_02135 [Clostridia bacterium]|nr:hypothetical protein [Clostridia bacterium]
MYNNFSDNEYSKEEFCCCECCRKAEKEQCYYPSFWCEEDKKENEKNYDINKYGCQKEYKKQSCGCENKHRESWVEDRESSKNYYGKNNCGCHEEKEEHNKKEDCHNQKPSKNQKRCCFCSLFNCCRW